MKRHVISLAATAAGFALSPVAQADHYGPPLGSTACTGSIQVPDQKLAPYTELDSLGDKPEDFIGHEGAGGLCMARTYTVAPPAYKRMKVYHVWNSATGKNWGRWWTLTPPQGSESQYRATHGICPSTGPTNRLDRMRVCWLKVGAEFAIGPGQSKECVINLTTKAIVPQTSVNSVYMALGARSYPMWVEDCTESASPFTFP